MDELFETIPNTNSSYHHMLFDSGSSLMELDKAYSDSVQLAMVSQMNELMENYTPDPSEMVALSSGFSEMFSKMMAVPEWIPTPKILHSLLLSRFHRQYVLAKPNCDDSQACN